MKYKITKADRMRIVHEYETGDLTYAELALKYGIGRDITSCVNKNSTMSVNKFRTMSTFLGKCKHFPGECKHFPGECQVF